MQSQQKKKRAKKLSADGVFGLIINFNSQPQLQRMFGVALKRLTEWQQPEIYHYCWMANKKYQVHERRHTHEVVFCKTCCKQKLITSNECCRFYFRQWHFMTCNWRRSSSYTHFRRRGTESLQSKRGLLLVHSQSELICHKDRRRNQIVLSSIFFLAFYSYVFFCFCFSCCHLCPYAH